MLRIRTTVDNDNIFLDLYRNEPVLLSLSFAELQDITKKNSNFSKAFSLPGSKKNNQVFNFFYDLNAIPTTFDPNNKFSATLMWDGYEIMVGYIRLNGVTIADGEIIYQVTFYNQVGDLMANIGDKFLFDLDLNYLSHPYDPSVILECNTDPNLFPVTGTTNYSYQNGKTMWGLYNIGYDYISANTLNTAVTPLVQFTPIVNSGGIISYNPEPGNFDFSGTPVHDYYFKPAIQAKELYEAIIREAGYIVESNFFDTAYFQRFYMPLKFVDETIYSRNAIPPCYTYTNTGITLNGFNVFFANAGENVECNTLGWTGDSSSLLVDSAYAGQYTFRFTFDLNPTISFCDDFTSSYSTIDFQFNDTISPPISLYQNTICDGTRTTVSFEQIFNLSGDSVLQFIFYGDNLIIESFKFEVVEGPRFIPNGSIINYDIEFPDNDYKQIDYITSINKYFNLVVVPNPDKPSNLIIEPIIDYIGKGEVLDWTTKIDFNQTQNLYPTTSLLNGTLEFEFKLDQDYANKDFQSQANRIFGTDKFKLGLEFKDTTTKFDYIFSSPIDITMSNSYVPIITLNSMSKLKQVDISGQTQQTFVPFKILPKLTFRGLTLPVDNYGFVGGTGQTLGDSSCVSGVTVNVTSPGWIKWADCSGIQSYQYFTNGSRIISGCINPFSVAIGTPYFPVANFTQTTGSPCTSLTPISVYQYWYMDDAQQDRFTNINRFTTYPFNYTGFSHYINFRGEDQSDVTPTQFSFVADDLYNIYYEPYIQDLISEENKIYAAKIYLLPQDIQKLRWNERILINNTYFRINKITNFNALEPAICDIELVKLTKEYPGHPKLFYDLIPCDEGEIKHTNSDIMFNLFAYAANYVKLYDESYNYLGCYGVTVTNEDPNVTYEKFWLSSAYTSNLVGVFADCGCTGRTEFDVIQEEPGEDRLFWYSALDCATSATTYTFNSTNADLLTGTTSYKLYNTGTTQTVCVFNPRPTFVQSTPWQLLSAYTNCEDCLFIPPTPTPTITPTNTPTPSITPTIPVTPSITPSPTATLACIPCYIYNYTAVIGGTVFWTRCDGSTDSQFVFDGESIPLTCARENQVFGDGTYTILSSCGTSCPPPTPSITPSQTPTNNVTCIQVVDTVIEPVPQTGLNNFFGVNVALDPYPVTESVTVTGYIRDVSDPSNRYDFSITIIGGTQSGETANNVLMTGPADSATIVITGITPTTVTYNGNSIYICGYEPEPTPTPSQTPTESFYYYSIRRYDCSNNCAVVFPDLIGKSSIPLSTTSGDFYKIFNSGFGSVVFQVQTEITPAPFGFDVNMDDVISTGSDCSSVCNA